MLIAVPYRKRIFKLRKKFKMCHAKKIIKSITSFVQIYSKWRVYQNVLLHFCILLDIKTRYRESIAHFSRETVDKI